MHLFALLSLVFSFLFTSKEYSTSISLFLGHIFSHILWSCEAPILNRERNPYMTGSILMLISTAASCITGDLVISVLRSIG